MTWIKPTDRLPSDGQLCLVAIYSDWGLSIDTATYRGHGLFSGYHVAYQRGEVAAWAKITLPDVEEVE